MKKTKTLILTAAILLASVAKAMNSSETVSINTNANSETTKLNSDTLKFDNLNGKYILLQYWTKRNANSLKRCIEMENTLRNAKAKNIEMVMLTINPMLLAATEKTTEQYVYNCLVDKNGAVIARNIKPEDLAMYIQTLE